MRREKRACRKVSERVGERQGWKEGCRVREGRSGRKGLDELVFDSESLRGRRKGVRYHFSAATIVKRRLTRFGRFKPMTVNQSVSSHRTVSVDSAGDP